MDQHGAGVEPKRWRHSKLIASPLQSSELRVHGTHTSKNSLRSLVEHESIRKGWAVANIGSVIRIRCKANSYTKLPATQWRVGKLQVCFRRSLCDMLFSKQCPFF